MNDINRLIAQGFRPLKGMVEAEQIKNELMQRHFENRMREEALGIQRNRLLSQGQPVSRYGQPKTGIIEGMPSMFVTDQYGNVKRLEGISPQEKPGISLQTPEGLSLRIGGAGGTTATKRDIVTKPEKSTKAATQKKLLGMKKKLYPLKTAIDNFDKNFLQYHGRMYRQYNIFADKTGVLPVDKKFLSSADNLFTSLGRFFNQYRHEITGAAAAIKELEHLKKDVLNANIGPTVFKSRMNAIMSEALMEYDDQKLFLEEGIIKAPEVPSFDNEDLKNKSTEELLKMLRQ